MSRFCANQNQKHNCKDKRKNQLTFRARTRNYRQKLKLHINKVGKFLTLPGFRKHFSNISWLMVEKIFRSVVLLAVGACVARYLGPGQFGLLSYAISFVTLFSAISTLGLDGIVVRELVKDEIKKDELLGTAFFLKLAGAFSVLAVLYIAVHFTSKDNLTNLLIFIIASSAVFRSFNVIDFYFQSIVLSKYVVYTQLVLLVISSFIKLFLIWIQAPLLYFSIVFLIDGIVLAIGLTIAYLSQKLNIFDWKFSYKLAKELIKDSWPLILSGVAVSIYMKIDQVMIKHILNVEAVGQYAAAVRLSEACYFIPMIICGSLFPAILNAKKQGEELYYTRLQNLHNLLIWIAIPVSIIVSLFADNIVNILYGKEYASSATVLSLHIWVSVFVFVGVIRGKWLVAEHLTRYSLIITLFGALANVGLNFFFIPRFGAVGAAMATVFTRVFISYILALVFLPLRPMLLIFHKSFLAPPKYLYNLLKKEER